MEFWITIIGLLRRKGVIIPALLVAAAMGAMAYLSTPISYMSSTTMVLTTTQYGGTESRDPTKPTDLTNPMLNFNDSLTTTSAILIEAMNTRAVDEKVGATGATQLIIDDGRTNPDLLGLNGPFLYIVGRSTSPEEAKRVVLQAQVLTSEKLRAWQSALNAPEKTYLTLAEVVPPSTPIPVRGRAIKYGILGFIFGFVLFMGIAYFWHQLRARRSALEAARAAAADASPPEPEHLQGSDPRPPTAGPEDDGSDVDDQDVGPVLEPTGLNGTAKPAVEPTGLNGTAKPAVEPTGLNGTAKPAVEPTGLNGTAKPAVEPTDPTGETTPAVEPTDLKGKAKPAIAGSPRSRRPRPSLVHVPVKLKARSRTP